MNKYLKKKIDRKRDSIISIRYRDNFRKSRYVYRYIVNTIARKGSCTLLKDMDSSYVIIPGAIYCGYPVKVKVSLIVARSIHLGIKFKDESESIILFM